MEKVSNDLFISVDYTGTLENGDIFDTSKGRQPLEIQMGAGQLIKGFESALAGMSLNETKVFTLDPEDAYGDRDDQNVHTFERSELPPQMDPVEGQTIGLTSSDGQQFPAFITKVDDAQVTVDLNHPLAGEKLTFDIKVVGISETATQPVGCGCGCGEESHGGGCGEAGHGSGDGCGEGCGSKCC
jgi:peptidylprolyl isomerase